MNIELPNYYILVKQSNDELDFISIASMEQTKQDLNDCKILQEFNNYLQLYDAECDLIINVYHYGKHNLCYGLFLHQYPINTVSKIINLLNEKYKPCCDCLLNEHDEELEINDFKDIFKLAGSAYHNYDDDIQLENDLHGGNLFNSVAELFKNGFNRVKNLITNPIRVNAPPYYRSFLETFGNLLIEEITICKTPIQAVFNGILNAISFGQWDKSKAELNYDNMYHLFMICKLVSGQYVRLEKNDTLSINLVNASSFKNAKSIYLGNYNQVIPFNLNQMHEKALNAVGKERLYLYRGDSTNYQLFIHDLLNNSGLMNEPIKSFIMQDANAIVSSLPTFAQKLMQGVTDTSAFFNHVLYGAGLLEKYKIKNNKHGGSLMFI